MADPSSTVADEIKEADHNHHHHHQHNSSKHSFRDQSHEELVGSSSYEDADDDDEEDGDEYHLLIRDNESERLQQSIAEANGRLQASSAVLQSDGTSRPTNKNMRLPPLIGGGGGGDHSSINHGGGGGGGGSSSFVGRFLGRLFKSDSDSSRMNNVSSSDEFIFRSSDWRLRNSSLNPINSLDRSLYGQRTISPSKSQAKKSSRKHHNRLSHVDDPSFRQTKQMLNNKNKTRTSQTLFILILFFLFLTSILFLVKLLSLIQQEQKRQLEASNDHSWNQISNLVADMGDEAHRRQYEAEQSARWLISSPKCHIPALEPWDPTIGEYVRLSAPMNCRSVIGESLKEKPASEGILFTETITEVRSNRLFFLEEAERRYNLLQRGHCCYKNVSRSPESDDDLEYSEKCQVLRGGNVGIRIEFPLIEVHCRSLNYTNVHAFVVHDQEEEDALRRVGASKLERDSHYNILMVGVDTMSRLNGARQLNRTLRLLKERYNSLEFYGYNKVGENTFPNLIPLLTGLKPNQLQATQCWMASTYTDESERGDDYLDNCKYLWNFYQQAGYVTYFSEDWPVASTFNYLKPGFKHEPTAYYGRPFALARQALLFPRFSHSVGCADCHLDRPIVKVDLDNLEAFIRGHNDMPYFAFHWINCPQHDDLNGASKVDQILEGFFENIHQITQNNRTFVFFFSDHGYRWNPFLSTRIGHYESSLPMLTIAAPKLFIEQHPDLYERLKRHQQALLTPFDMFHSLLHLRNLGLKKTASGETPTVIKSPATLIKTTVTPNAVEQPPTTAYPTASTTIKQLTIQDGSNYEQDFKTISLFDEHTAAELDRSCIEAGIPDNYCVCHQFKNVPITRDDVLGAAYYLVYIHLESRLSKHLNLCHQLELEKLHKAEMFNLGSSFNSTKPKSSGRRRRRRRGGGDPQTAALGSSITTTPGPIVSSSAAASLADVVDDEIDDKQHLLPKREYNIFFSTKPGSALFQEVVRYYGDDFHDCISEIKRAKKIVTDEWAQFDEKRESVWRMNKICRFSVHSESISRLNLYRDQSKCVKSNIELKKICLCKTLVG